MQFFLPICVSEPSESTYLVCPLFRGVIKIDKTCGNTEAAVVASSIVAAEQL